VLKARIAVLEERCHENDIGCIINTSNDCGKDNDFQEFEDFGCNKDSGLVIMLLFPISLHWIRYIEFNPLCVF
jgi:hypothetical protein